MINPRRKPSSLRNLKDRQDAKNIVCRMCVVAKVKDKKGLAKKLGIKLKTIDNWILTNKVPFKHIYNVADKFDGSFDFIELGFFFEPDDILRDAELEDYKDIIKFPYIKKPIKQNYILSPYAYGEFDPRDNQESEIEQYVAIENMNSGNVSVKGNNNIAFSGDNNTIKNDNREKFHQIIETLMDMGMEEANQALKIFLSILEHLKDKR